MKIKYIWIMAAILGFSACEKESTSTSDEVVLPELTAGDADFSNFVSVGASFTAGFVDGGLFIASQENSFPNTLAKQFAKAGGGDFSQPLMNDNFGGLALAGNRIQGPRLVFGGAGPVPLEAVIGPVTVGTDITNNPSGPFNNLGVPGAKSFHLVAPGYGNIANVATGLANPYAVRLTGSTPDARILELAVAQNATFFTLSEIGGNDVLGYATSGGTGVSQEGNLDPSTYGPNDITDSSVFESTLNGLVSALTANDAKGAIGNLPDITSLSHFTTVPHDPLNPETNADYAASIPLLNTVFGSLNQIYEALGEPERSVVFSETENSPVVIRDENLADISAQITGALNANPGFPLFVESLGLPAAAAPLVANLLGLTYGQTRPATENDLLVLPSSSVIGTINTDSVAFLMSQGLPEATAAQFSTEGLTFPLEDKWVLLPQEQQEIANATAAYNMAIETAATNNGLALVDLNSVLEQATTSGVQFDEFNLNTSLVFGGLVSLDGIHLTARGYALMANSFLEAIDATYGSNFVESGNVAKAADFVTNFSPTLP